MQNKLENIYYRLAAKEAVTTRTDFKERYLGNCKSSSLQILSENKSIWARLMVMAESYGHTDISEESRVELTRLVKEEYFKIPSTTEEKK